MRVVALRVRVLIALTVVASAAPSCGFETRYFGGDVAAMDVSLASDADGDDDAPDDDPESGDARELEVEPSR